MNDSFSNILSEIKRWFFVSNIQEKFNDFCFKITENDLNIFRVIFETKNCMGEIMVNRPDFAPYRFVKIEIWSIIQNSFVPIFSWFDTEDDNCEYILTQLERGLKCALNHKL